MTLAQNAAVHRLRRRPQGRARKDKAPCRTARARKIDGPACNAAGIGGGRGMPDPRSRRIGRFDGWEEGDSWAAHRGLQGTQRYHARSPDDAGARRRWRRAFPMAYNAPGIGHGLWIRSRTAKGCTRSILKAG